MEDTIKQSDIKFEEIGVNQHYSFLVEFFIKWNSVDQLTEDKLEDWNADIETIKETLNYLSITEIHRCPFAITYKVGDCLASIALIPRSDGRIEFVRTLRTL